MNSEHFSEDPRLTAYALGELGPEECVAVEVLILVEVVAHAHAHGLQRRRLVGEARNHDGDHVGTELRQIFE